MSEVNSRGEINISISSPKTEDLLRPFNLNDLDVDEENFTVALAAYSSCGFLIPYLPIPQHASLFTRCVESVISDNKKFYLGIFFPLVLCIASEIGLGFNWFSTFGALFSSSIVFLYLCVTVRPTNFTMILSMAIGIILILTGFIRILSNGPLLIPDTVLTTLNLGICLLFKYGTRQY